MVARFSYIHLTDFHFCREPLRKNASYLFSRRPDQRIDTLRRDIRSHGFKSLFLPSSYIPAYARGVAQFCLEWSQAADGIIITGDLATTGTTFDISVAASFVKDAPVDGFMTGARSPTLAAANLPIYVVAGNHDRYDSNTGAPNSTYFDLIFSDYTRQRSPYIGSWVSEKRGGKLGFVSADFSLRTRADAEYLSPFFAYGQGRVYEDLLAALVKETNSIREQHGRIPIVWAVHFAPFDCGRSLRFIDFDRILESAEAAGVLATICGHTHRSSRMSLDAHVVYCGGSACCADAEEDCRVHVLHFDVDTPSARIARQNFKWSPTENEFIEIPAD